MNRKHVVAMGLILGGLVFAGRGQAQTQAAQPADQKSLDQSIDLLRKDVRSQKKQLIAANMPLTDAQAEKFWPVYDKYTEELTKINDEKTAIIQDYAKNYTSMTDEMAESLTKRLLNVDQSITQLRMKYLPQFKAVVGGKGTALFFQLDRRVAMLIDLQLAAMIPLVEP